MPLKGTLTKKLFGNPSSPPLVFLHGLLGSTEDYIPMINELKKDFYCIGIDLPGHGVSPLISPLTLHSTLKAIKETLQDYGMVSIIGYSLGGRLAMLLEYYYPHLIKSMMLLSTHPGLTSQEKKQRLLLEKKWVSLLQQDLGAFLKEWYSQPLFKTLPLEDMVRKRFHLNKSSIEKVMQALSIIKQPSLWNHLNHIKIPLIFLYGEYDASYKALYEKLPSSLQKKEIPRASHAIHLENAQLCTNIFIKNSFII